MKYLMLNLDGHPSHSSQHSLPFPGQPGCLETFLQQMTSLTRLRLNFRRPHDNFATLDEVRRGLISTGLKNLELGKFNDSENALKDVIGQFDTTIEEVVLFKVRNLLPGF
jgi:hypothetical protein